MSLEKTFRPKQDFKDGTKHLNQYVNVVSRLRRTAKLTTKERSFHSPVSLYKCKRSSPIEISNTNVLQNKDGIQPIPEWVDHIDKNYRSHCGEAPIFSENILPPNKKEQIEERKTGIVRKTRRAFANDSDLFCQTHRTRNYLLASKAPFDNDNPGNRLNRATLLRNTYREQEQSAAVYDAAKVELKRRKERPDNLNYRWLPTKYQLRDAPHSFMVGTRYTACKHVDIKSFDQIGLYIPKLRPATSFLKSFQGQDSVVYDKFAEEENISGPIVRASESKTRGTSVDLPCPSQRTISPTTSSPLKEAIRSYFNDVSPPRTRQTPISSQTAQKCQDRLRQLRKESKLKKKGNEKLTQQINTAKKNTDASVKRIKAVMSC